VALSGDELTEMRMKVQSGELPSDAIKRYYEEEEARTVYGSMLRSGAMAATSSRATARPTTKQGTVLRPTANTAARNLSTRKI
jgi:hypothetical protein